MLPYCTEYIIELYSIHFFVYHIRLYEYFQVSGIAPSLVFVLVVAMLGLWLGGTWMVYDRRMYFLNTWARLR